MEGKRIWGGLPGEVMNTFFGRSHLRGCGLKSSDISLVHKQKAWRSSRRAIVDLFESGSGSSGESSGSNKRRQNEEKAS